MLDLNLSHTAVYCGRVLFTVHVSSVPSCFTGTGKTSSARLLSRRSALPLVYVPLEALVSKWYGESEQNMAKVRGCGCARACVFMYIQ